MKLKSYHSESKIRIDILMETSGHHDSKINNGEKYGKIEKLWSTDRVTYRGYDVIFSGSVEVTG